MKKVQKFVVLLISFIASSFSTFAQETLLTHVLPGTPTAFDADASGDFYVGFENGQVIKFQKDGKKLETFSLPNNSAITLIDAQNRLKPFLFQFDIQRITMLDRFSSVPKIYKISDLNFSLTTMACPSPDGDFYILENNPQRLIKYNPLRKSILLEVQPEAADSVVRMKAFQNVLLIADNKGVHVYDVFGSRLHSLRIQNVINLQIIKGEAYIFTSKEVIIFNPFTGQIGEKVKTTSTRTVMKLPDYWVTLAGNTLKLVKDTH